MFRSVPVLRMHQDDWQWTLELPLVWEADGEIIVVPPGFQTDLASIPQVFHSFIPVNGRHRAPAILHDYLFTIQDRTRAETDKLFLDAMVSAGVPWPERWIMYLAVRVGGRRIWDRRAYAATVARRQ